MSHLQFMTGGLLLCTKQKIKRICQLANVLSCTPPQQKKSVLQCTIHAAVNPTAAKLIQCQNCAQLLTCFDLFYLLQESLGEQGRHLQAVSGLSAIKNHRWKTSGKSTPSQDILIWLCFYKLHQSELNIQGCLHKGLWSKLFFLLLIIQISGN